MERPRTPSSVSWRTLRYSGSAVPLLALRFCPAVRRGRRSIRSVTAGRSLSPGNHARLPGRSHTTLVDATRLSTGWVGGWVGGWVAHGTGWLVLAGTVVLRAPIRPQAAAAR